MSCGSFVVSRHLTGDRQEPRDLALGGTHAPRVRRLADGRLKTQVEQFVLGLLELFDEDVMLVHTLPAGGDLDVIASKEAVTPLMGPWLRER